MKGIKVKFIVAWYDFWIGFYWDRAKKTLYFLPIPCAGIVVQFPWHMQITWRALKRAIVEWHYRHSEYCSCLWCGRPVINDFFHKVKGPTLGPQRPDNQYCARKECQSKREERRARNRRCP